MDDKKIAIPSGKECYMKVLRFNKILKSCPFLEKRADVMFCLLFKKKVICKQLGLSKIVCIKLNPCKSKYPHGGTVVIKEEEENGGDENAKHK